MAHPDHEYRELTNFVFWHLMMGKCLCYMLSGGKEDIQLWPYFYFKNVHIFVYTSLKNTKKKKSWETFGWWDYRCWAFSPPWNTCLLHIEYNSTITFLSRKIFSRQVSGVCLTSPRVNRRLGRVSWMCLTRTLCVDWAVLELSPLGRMEPASSMRAFPRGHEKVPTAPAGSRSSDRRILGEVGSGSVRGLGCWDTTFLYVNTADTGHWEKRVLYWSLQPGQQPERCCHTGPRT